MKRFVFSVMTALIWLSGINVWALEKDAKGVYQISTSADMLEFANLINGGEVTANAVLTADVNYTENIMLGIGGKEYQGILDGQGHTLTVNIDHNAEDDGVDSGTGLFRQIGDNGKVCNLIVDGTVKGTTGVGTFAWEMRGTIENCISLATVESKVSGNANTGGIACAGQGNGVFKNVIFAGRIKGAGSTSQIAGFCWWVANGITFQNCATIPISVTDVSFFQVWSNPGNGARINCYYTEVMGTNNTYGAIGVTDAAVAGGELCYKLNGNQSNIAWTQTIGVDNIPYPFTTHKQVYAFGVNCGGQATDVVSYGNTEAALPDHTYGAGYICSVCGAIKEDYCTQEDGFFMLGTPEDFNWFTLLVNSGKNSLSAKLTADIDYTAFNTMLGTGGFAFQGTLDGQGHTLTVNIDHNAEDDGMDSGTGLFRQIGPNGKVCNLIVDGTVKGTTGVGTFAWEMRGTIENCISLATVESKVSGNANTGGIACAGQGSGVFKNVIFAGNIKGAGSTSQIAGFCWWVANDITFQNCATIPVSVADVSYFQVWSNPGNGVRNNCYYKEVMGTNNTYGAAAVTEDAVTSGELCFKLNGDQSTIAWTQTLGEDEMPYPFTTHSQVYSVAGINCGGQPIGEIYSNSPSSMDRPPHTYNGGFMCIVCGHVIEDYMQEQDGYYYLSTAEQLGWFAYKVNQGNTSMNAIMTEDIDFSNFNVMIGTNGKDYQGIFDGAEHKLTVNIDHQADGTALFSHIGAKGKVCNLVVDGTICGTTGIGTFAWETWGTIENCVSLVTLKSTLEDYVNSYTGGLACASRDNAVFKNCVFAGSFEGEEAYAFAGFVYFDNNGHHTLENCLFAPTEVNIANGSNFSIDQPTGRSIITNCVVTYDLGNIYGDCRLVDAQTLKSGSICYSMNKGEIEKPVWTQTLGEDELPYPFNDHAVVYMLDETTYMCIYDETSMNELQTALYEMENERLKDALVSTAKREAFDEILYTLNNTNNIDEFNTAYKEWQTAKPGLDKNIQAYADYVAFVDEMKTFMENYDIQSTASEQLASYLYENVEPGEDFPNGSYDYIIENMLLDTDEILAEKEFLIALYNKALKDDYMKDTDITDLLTNADFSERNTGWSGKSASGFDTNGPVAECNNNTFNMTQTLTGLKSGVYEVDMNGFFRPAGDNESRFYTAFLSANDQQVPFMHSVADAIAVTEAVNMENCYITELTGQQPYDEFYNDDFLIPGSMQGATYAFKGGRYQNRILVNVEDGTLTIGVRSDGTGCDKDWTVFANTKLYYRGTLDEATESMDKILAGQVLRANEILDGRVDVEENYAKFPNFSQDLRNRLQAAIDAGTNANNADDKYEVIKTFSKLFEEVEDCQKAYVQLYAKCDNLVFMYGELYYTHGAISEDVYNSVIEKVLEGYEAYSVGAFTADEAKEWGDESLYPIKRDGDVYLLGNATDLAVFGSLINSGQTNISGRLTADIDFSEVNMMLGAGGKDFQGTLDGQGHTLNVNIDHQGDGTGLFSRIGEKGKVCNLVVAGTISGTTGIGTFAWESWGTIENCVSLATIRSSVSGRSYSGGITCASHKEAAYRNCIFAGSFEGENVNSFAGINYFNNLGTPVYENCVSAPVSVAIADGNNSALVFEKGGTMTNSYYTDAIVSGFSGSLQISQEAVLNGELCFKLNGNQDDVVWTQTLGEDNIPYPFTTHSQVYSTAELNCAGQPLGETSYTNTPTTTIIPPHTYNGGFICEVCGHVDENYCKEVNGFYQIGTANQMNWFTAMVNNGKTSINAQLTTDIDYTAFNTMLGTGGNAFQGTLDGQSHTLTVNIDHNAEDDGMDSGTGLFRQIGPNGKVCNLIVDGTVKGTTGVGTFAWEMRGTIENCVSLATVESKVNGNANTGGIACAGQGNGVFRNVIFAGRIKGAGSTGQIAGFCWWVANDVTFQNCATVPVSVADVSYFQVWSNPGNGVRNNCYFKEVMGTNNTYGTTAVTEEAVSSGELCYKLNGDQSIISWTQTLGEDDIPYPFGTHAIITLNEDGTYENSPETIDLIRDVEVVTHNSVYDLSGRKLNNKNLPKGIYILNGKKYFVR